MTDRLQAILAWYSDELGQSKPGLDQEAANAIVSPLGKMALQTPKKPGRPKSKLGSHSQVCKTII